jgi:hypothetical protein
MFSYLLVIIKASWAINAEEIKMTDKKTKGTLDGWVREVKPGYAEQEKSLREASQYYSKKGDKTLLVSLYTGVGIGAVTVALDLLFGVEQGIGLGYCASFLTGMCGLAVAYDDYYTVADTYRRKADELLRWRYKPESEGRIEDKLKE